MKITTALFLSLTLLCSSALASESTLTSRAQVASQDLDSGSLSFTTTFLESDAGFLSYVGISFDATAEASETCVVYAASRMGSTFDTELARTSTTAATTRTITFLFNGAIPVSGLDQIKITCTNASQSVSEVNNDPTVSVTVVVDNAERGAGNVHIFKDGAFVVSSLLHDYRMHTGDIIPDANQAFGAYYSDISDIAVPSNPSAGTRRIFSNSATNELSVRTSAGATVSLESQPHAVEEEGVSLTQRATINCVDNGLTCSDTGGKTQISLAENAGTDINADLEEETHASEHNAGGGDEVAFYATVQEDGASLTQRRTLNITGAGATCSDVAGVTTCDIPSGAGSGDLTDAGACVNGACGTGVLAANDIFPLIQEGTADAVETTLAVTDPTSSDKTITFPNLTGTVALQSAAGFTDGSIPFYASSQLAQDNASLFWDDADNELGISNTSPAYDIDVQVSSSASQLHFTGNNADDGGYLTSTGTDNFFTAGGAAFDATNWIAKDTEASIIGSSSGNLRFYTNDTLTIGNSFTPTQRMHIAASNGNVGIATTSPDGSLDVQGGDIYITEISAPSTPASGKGVFYEKTDNLPYFKNDAGTEISMASRTVFTSHCSGGSAADHYLSLSGNITTCQTAVDSVESIVSTAVTCTNLSARVDVAPGAGITWTITLDDDTVDTALSCTIADAATTCTDTETGVSIAAGSVVHIEVIETVLGAAASAGTSVAVTCYT